MQRAAAAFGPDALLRTLVVLAFAVLTWLLWPVLALMANTLGGGAVHLRAMLAEPGLLKALANSLAFAASATLVATAVGCGSAIVFTRVRFPGRQLWLALAVVPLFVPGALYTLAWVFLASPSIGVLNQVLAALGMPSVNLYGLAGMAWVEGVHAAPMVFLLVAAMLRSVHTEQEQAARLAGAGALRTLWHITLPLVMPAVGAAALLVFMRAMGTFEVPAMLGLPHGWEVLSSRIYSAITQHPGDLGPAAAYATLLLAFTLLGVLLLEWRWGRRQDLAAHQFAPRAQAVITPRRAAQWLLVGLVAAWLLLTTVAPLAVLVWAALQPYYTTPGQLAQGALGAHLGWAGFERVMGAPVVRQALANTLLLAGCAAAAVVALGLLMAWLRERGPRALRAVLDTSLHSVLALPGMVLAMALLVFHVGSPLGLYGSLWLLALAYATRLLPHGVRYGRAALAQMPAELDAAARCCGAPWHARLRQIHAPLMLPVLAAGWLFTVALGARELSTALLLYTPGGEVIPVVFWQYWEGGQLQDLAALSVLFVAVLLAVAALARRVVGGRA